jgi:arsenate reductase
MLTIYTYAACGTCRRARQWLRARGVPFTERPIREQPPSLGELRAMLEARGGDLRRLCNTSGRDYRELKLGDMLAGMAPRDCLDLLHRNGNLVKRPFLLGPGVALVGFDEAAWQALLPAMTGAAVR